MKRVLGFAPRSAGFAAASAMIISTLVCTSAAAGGLTPIAVTVNEAGVGSISGPGFPAFPLGGIMSPDFGPGGLPSALTYSVSIPGVTLPPVVVGDLLIAEFPGGQPSDLVRFQPIVGAALVNSLVFYSDFEPGAPDGDLADTGLPTAHYTNIVSLVEGPIPGGVGVIYHPTPTQPGYVPGWDVTYYILSDADVPSPGTAALLGLGGLIATRRRR